MAKKEKQEYNLVTPQVTPVFIKNMECKYPVVVNRGGAGSGKTHALCQLMVYKFLTEKNKKFLLARKSLPSLRMSVLLYLERIFDDFGVNDRIKFEKVMLNYKFNNNLMHLGSVDDPQKMKCFHPDTDILTNKGFINIKDINIGDLIATIDITTKKMTYKPASNVYSYDYEGNMLSPQTKDSDYTSRLDFCVTPNHKMIRKTAKDKNLKFIEASSFLQTKEYENYLPVNCNYNEGNTIDCFEILKEINENYKKNGGENTKFNIVPWLKFLGWYLSEGSLKKEALYIVQTKEDTVNLIRKDLEELGLHFYKDKTGFCIYSKDLNKYCQQFGKSEEKHIPRDILNLHPSLLQHLFKTLILGGGRKVGKNSYKFTTISKQLLEDMCELSIKLGYSIYVYKKQLTPKKNKYCYSVSIIKKEFQNLYGIKESFYKGKVYCIEVPPFNTLLSRYNGSCIWTGNSSEWNYIWLEEATDFTYEDYQLIRGRLRAPITDGKTNQMFLSFNPIDESHWIKTELLEKHDDIIEIHSTYKDNPFLPEEAIDFYEKAIDYDINYYRVYALGEWGKLEDLVYSPSMWDIIKTFPDTFSNDIYGLDFGFNAPSSLVHGVYKEREVWVEELLHRTGLTNTQLIEEMKKAIPENKRNRPIYADSAEPDRIKEIRQAGFNCKAALKDVKDGIDFVKRMKMHITEDSSELIKELKGYSYKKDSKRNLILDEPIPYADHGCDSCRYMIFTHLHNVATYRVRWL